MDTESSSRPLGRPPKFSCVEEMQELIDRYFASRLDSEGNIAKPMSVTGLSLALGITRETLDQYQKLPAFSDSVKLAKLRVENFYEERLSFANATGSIFALKNFGWKDTQYVDQTVSQKEAPTTFATPEEAAAAYAEHVKS